MPFMKLRIEHGIRVIECAVIVYDVHSPAGVAHTDGCMSEYGIQFGSRRAGEQADFHRAGIIIRLSDLAEYSLEINKNSEISVRFISILFRRN